jgi:hypothetical protein
MRFQSGTSGNPHGRPKEKPIADALRYIGAQPYLSEKKIGLPKKPTVYQVAAARMWKEAINGDVSAFKEIADRTEGKVAQAIASAAEDAPSPKQDMNLREVARRIGYILLTAQHEQERKREAKMVDNHLS